jgi:hypothetical protein
MLESYSDNKFHKQSADAEDHARKETQGSVDFSFASSAPPQYGAVMTRAAHQARQSRDERHNARGSVDQEAGDGQFDQDR